MERRRRGQRGRGDAGDWRRRLVVIISRVARVFTAVCLIFQTISQKPIQLGSPNVTYKCYTMSPGNPLILRSKVKV